MLYRRRMQGQACGVILCKEAELASWMWEMVESESRRSLMNIRVNHVEVEKDNLMAFQVRSNRIYAILDIEIQVEGGIVKDLQKSKVTCCDKHRYSYSIGFILANDYSMKLSAKFQFSSIVKMRL